MGLKRCIMGLCELKMSVKSIFGCVTLLIIISVVRAASV